MPTVLITGASGLLGKALVERFSRENFFVIGQYHRHPVPESEGLKGLFGDFSSLDGIWAFLEKNGKILKRCDHLINGYGPLNPKKTKLLTAADLLHDFGHNVATALEITRFLLEKARLEAVVNIGFEFCGQGKAYKKILGYAMAKNALCLLTQSLAAEYPRVRFNMVLPPVIQGAVHGRKDAGAVAPSLIADRIWRVMKQKRSGCHIRIKG